MDTPRPSGSEPRPIDTLGQVKLFKDLPPHALAELASHCRRRRLADGTYLFHANDPADRLVLVAEGHFEVLRVQPDTRQEVRLSTIGPGAVVGELAILRGERRSASVRCRGPALVYEIDAMTFVHYARRWPELAWSIARSVADEYVASERRRNETRAPLWGVALARHLPPTLPLDLARAALPYVRARSTSRHIFVLAPIGAQVIEERGLRIEVRPLVFPKPREVADFVNANRPKAALVIVGGQNDALAEILGETTALVGAAPLPETSDTVKRVTIGELGAPSATHVRGGPQVAPAALAGRLARLLLGTSVGLALSGGAARGLAQLGVLDALETLGVPVDFLVGTSVGAALGGFALANGLPATLALARELRSPARVAHRFLDRSFRRTGILDGDRLLAFLERHLQIRLIEELPIPFGAVALDAETGDGFLAQAGPLADALRASGVLPGLLAPHTYQPPGRERPAQLVDGSVVNLVPIDAVRSLGADRVVGVHVARMRELVAPLAAPVGGASPVAMALVQAHLLGLARLGERQVFTADVALLPDAGAFGFAEFWRGDELIELGRTATLGAAVQLRLLLA